MVQRRDDFSKTRGGYIAESGLEAGAPSTQPGTTFLQTLLFPLPQPQVPPSSAALVVELDK